MKRNIFAFALPVTLATNMSAQTFTAENFLPVNTGKKLVSKPA